MRQPGVVAYGGRMSDSGRTPAVRVSDAEREAAMGRLRDAAAEGRMTFEELADRIEAADGAVTRKDLERLTEDLPPAPAGTPSTEAARLPTRTSTVFGDVRRAAPGLCPPGASGRASSATWCSSFERRG
jgi:hypothetical protein